MSGRPGGVRIAMWSGPRNISTAMMRSWEARGDTAVADEPLYAHYLKATGKAHPGAPEVIAAHETDWRRVAAALTGPIPGGKAVFYQKHMAHHLLPGIETGWVDALTNCFLIREPRAMLVSLAKVTPNIALEDTGLPQQEGLVARVRERTGRTPPVVDAKDVLLDPAGMLRRLCDAVGVEYTDRMLRWEPGLRATDGVWARHWYANTAGSTGFAPYAERDEPIPDRLRGLLDECEAIYTRLAAHRLTGAGG